MGHTAFLSDCGRFVGCRVHDDITIERARQFTKDTVDLGKRHQITRFLYDARGVRNIETVFRNYQFANEDMARLNVDRAGTFAVVTDPDDRSHDFVETAIRNAGYDVRMFSDHDAALCWLLTRGRPTLGARAPIRAST